ncbi:MAG: MarR family transcriptional regulator [Candidatus Delongbacteria bacterium]|nr:MarR family transcriptional regulator [Candidatus Delongbacteria bacterium]
MDELGNFIKRVSDQCTSREMDIAAHYRLTLSESRAIRSFRSPDEKIKMTELSNRMELAESRITRIIDSLVKKKYIVRENSAEDRRVVFIGLTEKGRSVFSELLETCDQLWRQIWKLLPDEVKGSIINDFRILDQVMDQIKGINP